MQNNDRNQPTTTPLEEFLDFFDHPDEFREYMWNLILAYQDSDQAQLEPNRVDTMVAVKKAIDYVYAVHPKA